MGKIRFVSHPLFSQSDALEQIERLKPPPIGADERAEVSSPQETPIGRLCRERVLSRREERYLFLRMNFEKFEANRSQDHRRAKHLAEARASRDRILATNFRLLVSVAGQFASPQLGTDDLVSEGVLPLMRAVELFDVSRGWAFGTYATHALKNHYRRTGGQRQRKNRLKAAFQESQMAELFDDAVPPARQEELAARHQHLVRRCLAELPATDQEILKTRFGFDDPAAPKLRSFAEVGKAVGLSKERARVRAHRALQQLRETAQNRRWEYPELDVFELRV